MQGIGADRRINVKNLVFLFVFLALILLDQITKTVCKNLFENSSWTYTEVIPDFFYFRYLFNTGAAYGILGDLPWAQLLFKIITPFAVIGFFFVYIYACKRGYRTLRIAIMLVICGSIGNFIDRVCYNGVVDFLNLMIGGGSPFGVFNFADVYMSVGAVLVVVHFLFLDKNALFAPRQKDGKKTA